MRRLLDMADWPWTDQVPGQGRYSHFIRSGEFLTTALLVAYALVLIWPASTFSTSPAFAWLSQVSNGNEAPWAIAACALALTGPLAVVMDQGTLRILSLISQGIYFLTFGVSFHVNSPVGLGWITFVVCGLWLLVRSVMLVRHHWVRGRAQ